ncbi:hypothetical protein A4R26_00215 [Niastella populi]|uniref:Uncharacterized protein n=1 Tax=Niastella populi TaxID=550983 RepID=A0A1V9GC63_9BACT|nr:hypothetical protein A4R26_00215 [Niastella populi]
MISSSKGGNSSIKRTKFINRILNSAMYNRMYGPSPTRKYRLRRYRLPVQLPEFQNRYFYPGFNMAAFLLLTYEVVLL